MDCKKHLAEYDNKHFHVLNFVLNKEVYIFIFLVLGFLVGSMLLQKAYM
nr:hypothetical protein [uncultured Prevotella sp.]